MTFWVMLLINLKTENITTMEQVINRSIKTKEHSRQVIDEEMNFKENLG